MVLSYFIILQTKEYKALPHWFILSWWVRLSTIYWPFSLPLMWNAFTSIAIFLLTAFFYWFVVALKESGINPLLIICVSKYSFQITGIPVADFEFSEVQKQRQLQPSPSSQLFSRPLNLGFSNLLGHSEDEFLESQHTYTYIWTEKWSSESISYTQLTTSKHTRTVSLHSIESMPHLALILIHMGQ